MERANSRMAGPERGRVALRVAVLLGLLCWLGGTGSALAAGTFVVDGADPTRCSDTAPGAGTEGNPPYCTISAAAAARGGPGTTILVKPAIYREQVNVSASGAEGSPFTFQALGPGVVVDGADDFSSTDRWTPFSGDVWLAAGVTWSPTQVLADGAPLTPSTAARADLAPGTYRHVLGEGLYVNLGGDNPGTHQILVRRRAHGFRVENHAWVTLDGFTVTRTEDRGIHVTCGGGTWQQPQGRITITHNTVTFANGPGIVFEWGRVKDCSGVLIGSNVVSDNRVVGIALLRVVNSMIQDNEVFRTANPPGGGASNGILLFESGGNLLQRNRVHENGGSGLVISDSPNTLSLQNLSWNNGGSGFEDKGPSGTLHVGDVAWENSDSGFFLLLSGSTNARIFNSVAVNNGLTGEREAYNLFMASEAVSGLVSNYNIFWNSTSQAPIHYNLTAYGTLAAFTAATGQDANSIQADPRFVNPAGGDFRLRPGSPAIDSADSSVAGWPAADAAGQARVDDPATPDTGAGPVAYAERGALEYLPFGPPLAALTVTPSSGRAPLAVTADASRSVDSDGTIVTYRFDFGDGTAPVQVQQPDPPTATHTYTAAGTFTASVTVTDDEGRTAAASAPVTVTSPNQPPVAALTLTPTSGTAPLEVRFDASGSSDPEGRIVSYLFDFGDGTVVGPQVSPTGTHVYGPGNRTATVTVTDELGATSSATAKVRVAETTSENLVWNPSFEFGTQGWSGYNGATIRQVAGGVEGAFALEVRGHGVNDSPNFVATTPAAGTRYRFTAWVRSAASTSKAWLRVREYLNRVQVGGTTDSAALALTPAWQLLLVDHVTQAGGSTLDFQVLAAPVTPETVFQVDQVAIRIVTAPSNQPPNGTIDSPAGDVVIPPGGSVSFTGTASDPDGHLPLTFLWSFGGGAPNARVEDPGAVTFSTPGTYTVRFTVTDSFGVSDPTPDSRVITVNAPPNGTIDSPAGPVTIAVGQSVSFSGTGTDPEGHLPLTFLWTFGGGAPNARVEDPGAVVFTTPGTYTVTFTVIDSLGVADPTPASRVITVVGSGTNLVGNPSFEADTSGWKPYPGSDTVIERVPGGQEGAFALEVRGPASTAAFGINDSPNWVGRTGAAGTRYRFSAWVRAETSTGKARIRVREYLNGVQVGGTTYSPFLPLTPDWQLLTTDHVIQAAGSTLDVQILDYPVAPGEVFQTDSIEIRIVP